MKYKFSSSDFLWLSLVLFVVLGLAFLIPVGPNDYWWYLRLGHDIVQAGKVPTVDTLSSTLAGQPVLYQPWLSALFMWWIYQMGGTALTFFVRGLVLALTYALLWIIARKAGLGARLTSLIIFIAVLATSNNWEIRPQLFVYPLFAAALFALFEWQNDDARWLWILPAAGLLWANLHGSFMNLFLLGGAALVFGKGQRRALALSLGLSFIATFLNPAGWLVWKSFAGLVSSASVKAFSSEWQLTINAGWQMNIFFLWMLAFPVIAVISQRKLSTLAWVWFAGFGWLAFSGTRFVIWQVMILIVLTAELLPEIGNRMERRASASIPVMDIALGVIFILMPLMVLPGWRESWWDQAPAAFADIPSAATEWLTAHPEVPDPIWTDLGFESYLTFALPARPAWTHLMFDRYPVAHWERYKAVDMARYDWSTIVDEEHINTMMVSIAGQKELFTALSQNSEWCESYQDGVAAIFIRLQPGKTCQGQ